MVQKCKKYILSAVIILSLLPGSISLGSQEDTDILPVKSVPDLKKPVSSVKYEELFNGRGIIHRVGKDEVGKKIIVIDDRLFYFDAVTKYYSLKGSVIPGTKFYKGKTVGYVLNDKKEITQLYMIDE
ncbi:MAG: hypothetical protein U9N77_14885 [Thermodesulfobacteriota bacterium]|nr:hypothetical protein [Thermodesulfobacteriota bacterium]